MKSILTFTLVLFALAACSNGGAQRLTPPLPGTPLSTLRLDVKLPNDLFVTDEGTGAVEILANKTWQNIGSLGSSFGFLGDWVDSKGNLYVANFMLDILEYAPGATKPSHTYKVGVSDPVNVTTDSRGNVYDGDFKGYVAEWAQNGKKPLFSCPTGDHVWGVAVDHGGDVFVTAADAESTYLAEYPHGLSGCKATMLPPGFEYAQGLALDKNNNLLVCDENAGTVTVNKANTQVYVTESLRDVQVLSYPSGTTIATLNSANGLSSPAGAVDGKNFNP